MKSTLTALGIALLLVAAVTAPVHGQPDIQQTTSIKHVLTPALRDLDLPRVAPTGFNVEIPIRVVPGGTVVDTGVVFPGTQRELTGVPAPGTLANFPGLSDEDNAAVVGGRIVPPDTDGK